MIFVTRLNGSEIVVNADLLETIEATPDTVLTLVDGTRYVVEEHPSEIIRRIQAYRSALLRMADEPIVWDTTTSPKAHASVTSLPVDAPTETGED